MDLTEEELIKEAEKVLAQSERIRCTADTPNSLAGIRLQEILLDGKCVKVVVANFSTHLLAAKAYVELNLPKKKKTIQIGNSARCHIGRRNRNRSIVA